MPFSTTTLQDVIAALGTRLADPDHVHWPEPELIRYIVEALRTWNALTAQSRETGVLSWPTATPFLDLPTVLPALRGYTITQHDLIEDCCHALQEVVSSTTWLGTEQYTLEDVSGAITRRRDLFLQLTGAVLTRSVLTIAPPPDGRIPLPATMLDVRRMAWHTPEGAVTPLLRDDEWGGGSYKPGWVQQPLAPPLTYSIATVPVLTTQLLPPPFDTGALDLVAVHAGADLDPSTPTLLGIPDDWAWVVKFGALADLLSRDGLALDPARAAYCEARWVQGIQLASAASVILTARINNVVVPIASLSDTDRYKPRWQSTIDQPRVLLTAGHTLIGLAPVPIAPTGGGGRWSITLDVVRNIPVPSLVSNDLQIAADAVDPLIDYAQHLAIFKEGPQQLEQSVALAERFYRFTGHTLMSQKAGQPARRPLMDQTLQDTRAVARVAPLEVGE